MIDPIIESEEQEQDSWFRRLSPEAQFRVLLIAVVAVMAVLATCLINLNTWGKPVLIAGAIIAILTGFYKWAVARERASLDYQHKYQHIEHAEHYRALTVKLADMGHSIQLKHVDHNGGIWELSSVSPMTIPNSPMSIENYYANGEPEQLQIAPPLTLPDKMMLIDVMKHWNLTPENLFLGMGKGMKEIACSIEGLMHVAHDAPTGGGKTSQWLAEIVQLLKLNVQVILCNPHFAPVDKKGNDWRPVGQSIEAQGWIQLADDLRIPGLIRNYENIANILKWLSLQEIDRRFNLQAQGIYSYKPLYIFIDEWPSVVRRYPEAGEYLTDVLQRGRAVEVNVDTNAQGFLQTDVNLQGSARENFNTAYHMGGTVHSGAKLLDMPVKAYNDLLRTEQVTLGRGIALLRNNESCPQAELVRLPLADNMYIYYMLGKADNWCLPEFRKRGNGKVETMETPIEADGNEIPDVGNASPQTEELRIIESDSYGNAIVETIKRLRFQQHMPFREIAPLVGMAGRKYEQFQRICEQEGIV